MWNGVGQLLFGLFVFLIGDTALNMLYYKYKKSAKITIQLLHNEHNLLLLPQVKTFSKLPKQIHEYLHQKQLNQKQYTTNLEALYIHCCETINRENNEDKRTSKRGSNNLQKTRERTSEEASRQVEKEQICLGEEEREKTKKGEREGIYL